jgi:hypothetical protein
LKKDIRTELAEHIYQNNNREILLVYKTTRAGCTTSLITASINRGEKFLCIVPTNKIADKTIIYDGIKFSDNENARVLHIPGNKKCLLIQKMINEHPILDNIPIIQIPNDCFICVHFNSCPITEVFRFTDVSGYVVTYQKLVALLIAGQTEGSVASEILDIIMNVKNIIFDEIHWLQFLGAKSLKFIECNTDDQKQYLNLKKYAPIFNDRYQSLKTIIDRCNRIISDKAVNEAGDAVLTDALSRDYFAKHIRKPLLTPCLDEIYKVSIPMLASGVFQEIVDFLISEEFDKISIPDILDLYDILTVATAPIISLGAVRQKSNIVVSLSVIDVVTIGMIKEFLGKVHSDDRRIILTSATICNLKRGDIAPKWLPEGIELQRMLFGENGDPKNTNSKMLILADRKRYHDIGRESIASKKDEIVDRIIQILDLYRNKNCMVVTKSQEASHILEHELRKRGIHIEVTYYKSDKTIGVSSKCRILIAIGLAYKPANSFDSVTNDLTESQTILEESIHVDTWQTWSRVKDPEGQELSIVFALGVPFSECKRVVTWGYDREVKIMPRVNGQEKNVEISCSQDISMPIVTDCKNFDMMLLEARLHRLPTINHDHLPKPIAPIYLTQEITIGKQQSKPLNAKLTSKALIYISNTIRAFESKFAQQLSKSDLLISFFSDGKMGASGLSQETRIKRHLAGKDIIKTCPITEDGMAKWLRFGELDDKSKTRLCNFLTLITVPYQLENTGEKYNVWIFLKSIEAKKAKAFGKYILKLTNIDCELLPDKVNVKTGRQETIKLPLSPKSSFFINGEFRRDFEKIDIETIDISQIDLDIIGKKVEEVTEEFKGTELFENRVYDMITSRPVSDFPEYFSIYIPDMIATIESRREARGC